MNGLNQIWLSWLLPGPCHPPTGSHASSFRRGAPPQTRIHHRFGPAWQTSHEIDPWLVWTQISLRRRTGIYKVHPEWSAAGPVRERSTALITIRDYCTAGLQRRWLTAIGRAQCQCVSTWTHRLCGPAGGAVAAREQTAASPPSVTSPLHEGLLTEVYTQTECDEERKMYYCFSRTKKWNTHTHTLQKLQLINSLTNSKLAAFTC